MARITICDLCKDRIKDDESKQGELTLSFYVPITKLEGDTHEDGEETEGSFGEHKELAAELCHSCTSILRKAIEGDDPLVTSKSPPKNPKRSRESVVEHRLADAYGDAGESLGPSEEEKAAREPTKELLDDEMAKVPSRFDKRKAAKIVASQKDKCGHHFKSYKEGAIICGPAPKGIQGELANFKGCGKTLTKAEF